MILAEGSAKAKRILFLFFDCEIFSLVTLAFYLTSQTLLQTSDPSKARRSRILKKKIQGFVRPFFFESGYTLLTFCISL